MSSVALFGTSSFLCGIAPSLGWLVFFRVLQGVGGGGLGPSEQAILADTFPPSRRGMAFAVYPIVVAHLVDHLHRDEILSGNTGVLFLHGVGAAAGPAIAGALMGWLGAIALPLHLGLAFLPLAVFALVLSRRSADEIVDEPAHFTPMMRTSPSLNASSRPVSPTLATASSSLVQITLRPWSTSPAGPRTCTAIWRAWPSSSATSSTSMRSDAAGTGPTVSVTCEETPSLVATITASPSASAVTSPPPVTVAMSASSDAHVTSRSGSGSPCASRAAKSPSSSTPISGGTASSPWLRTTPR